MESPTLVICICESKGISAKLPGKGNPFPILLSFPTSKDAFSEGFETGTLRTSDWGNCQLFQIPLKEDPLVLSFPKMLVHHQGHKQSWLFVKRSPCPE